MPTIFRTGGLRFVIWLNDHPPPHIHVFSADAEAKIELGTLGEKPRLIENKRMRRGDLASALAVTLEQRDLFLRSWEEIHG